MKDIGIISFNSASISKKMQECNYLEYINLEVTLDGESYTDKSIKELTDAVDKIGVIPKTSQPTTGEFVNKFAKMLKNYENIVVLTPSEDLSGTHQNAILSKEQFSEDEQKRIHIVCTKSFALSEAICADLAIDLIDAGKGLNEVITGIEDTANNLTTFIIPGSFAYLKKSGRINMAQLAIGKLMNLSLLIRHKNGLAEVYKKERGFKRILKAIDEDLKDQENIKKIYISGLNPDEDEYDKLMKILSEKATVIEAKKGSIVMTAHFGAKTLGYLILT